MAGLFRAGGHHPACALRSDAPSSDVRLGFLNAYRTLWLAPPKDILNIFHDVVQKMPWELHPMASGFSVPPSLLRTPRIPAQWLYYKCNFSHFMRISAYMLLSRSADKYIMSSDFHIYREFL
jgi:hypothetical protein